MRADQRCVAKFHRLQNEFFVSEEVVDGPVARIGERDQDAGARLLCLV